LARTDLNSGKQKETPLSLALEFFDEHSKDLKNKDYAKHLPETEDYAVVMNSVENLLGASSAKPSTSTTVPSFEREFLSSKGVKVGRTDSATLAPDFQSSSPQTTVEVSKNRERVSPAKSVVHSDGTGFQSSSLSALKAHKATKEAARENLASQSAVISKPKRLAPPTIWPSMTSITKKCKSTPHQVDYSGPIVRQKRPSVLGAPSADQIPPELDNHHIYLDQTGYTYNVTLVRINIRKNTNERFILKIYESHTEPHTYALHQRYANIRFMPASEILVPAGSDFNTAFSKLKEVFEAKTGTKWENRMKGNIEDPVASADDGDSPFVFVKPKDWQPSGVMMRQKKERKAATNGATMLGTFALPSNVLPE
jgi:hypothetical protein